MDQIKEILRQAIHYRFWIAVGLSAVLPVVAYFLGAGEIQAKSAAKKAEIEGANNAVNAYTSGKPANGQYKAIAAEKTEVLSKDVRGAWEKLYERQAPLLKWPERVQERFTAWGRQWPKETDASAVQLAIIDYVNAYQAFVTEVYKTFRPFDYTDGSGVVAAPPEDALLRPDRFSENEPPDLGRVWSAQERLWIQRTLLDVVETVNKGAKSWDTAVIKQINALEVGNPAAQDQRSLAKGEALEPAPPIVDPTKPPAPPPAAPAPGSASAPGSAAEGPPANTVMYIKSDSPAYKVLPVELDVLIDQDHIQDLLVALENSPMTIQVKDFEMSRPTTRVTKPAKGAQMAFNPAYPGGMPGGYPGGYPYSQPITGFGGQRAMDLSQSSSAYPYGPGGGAPPPPVRKGVDVRDKDLRGQRAKAEAEARKGKSVSLHDPYYNIVQVKVYGQARFFNPPPPAPAATPSQAATPPADEAKKDEAKKDETKKDETAKDEAKKDEAKKDEAKKDEAKKDEATKDEAKKGEPKKDETKGQPAESRKDEAKKDEARKDEPAKDEPKKDEAKKDGAGGEEKKAGGEPAKADAPSAK